MDYLTEYYKNKCKKLEEKYNFLLILNEDMSSVTDEWIEEWIKGNAQNEQQAAVMRESLRNRRARDQAKKNKVSEEPANPQENTKKSTEGKANTGAENPKSGVKGEEPPVHPKSGVKPSEPPVQSKPGFKGRAATVGAGFATGYVADEVTRAALSAAGIEDEVTKDIAATAANMGVGGATEAALGAMLRGAGVKAAFRLGAKAAGPLAAAGAAGEALGNYVVKPVTSIKYNLPDWVPDSIEKKGNEKSTIDRYSDLLYKGSPFMQLLVNPSAGNSLFASPDDLNTKPTGVAGGDPSKIEQNKREEEEEKAEIENRQAAEKTRMAGRAARIAQKVAALKAQEANK